MSGGIMATLSTETMEYAENGQRLKAAVDAQLVRGWGVY